MSCEKAANRSKPRCQIVRPPCTPTVDLKTIVNRSIYTFIRRWIAYFPRSPSPLPSAGPMLATL